MRSRKIMKKILCFIDSLGAGGAQRQMVGLALMLKEKGYRVKVLVYHDNPFFLQTLEEAHVDVEINHKTTKHFSRIYYIYKSINSFNPDVVISYLDTPNIIASICKLLGGKFKLIVSERNTTQKITKIGRLKYYLFKKVDYVVPNSFTQENFIKEHFKYLIPKLKVIPNFVDTDYFVPIKINMPYKEPIILSVGRITPQKNILTYLRAIAILRDNGHKFKAVWYGNTDNIEYESECFRLLNELNLHEVFEFRPASADILKKYQEATIFCLPSLFEGTPNVICEAMSCGVPIICSDVCDNSRLVEDSRTGYLFNPLDSKDISDKLNRMLILTKKEYDVMSDNCRFVAKEKFSKKKFIDRYLTIVQ